MLVDAIQVELVRLQLHPVNLSVAGSDEPQVALQGSLLRYWTLPPCLDGPWLLAQLQRLPNAAGPEAVMTVLVAAYLNDHNQTTSGSTTQLRLLDSPSQIPATASAILKKDG